MDPPSLITTSTLVKLGLSPAWGWNIEVLTCLVLLLLILLFHPFHYSLVYSFFLIIEKIVTKIIVYLFSFFVCLPLENQKKCRLWELKNLETFEINLWNAWNMEVTTATPTWLVSRIISAVRFLGLAFLSTVYPPFRNLLINVNFALCQVSAEKKYILEFL